MNPPASAKHSEQESSAVSLAVMADSIAIAYNIRFFRDTIKPRRGGEAGRALKKSLEWLDRVRETVRRISAEGCGPDSPEFGSRVLTGLGLASSVANPLTLITLFAEHVAALNDRID